MAWWHWHFVEVEPKSSSVSRRLFQSLAGSMELHGLPGRRSLWGAPARWLKDTPPSNRVFSCSKIERSQDILGWSIYSIICSIYVLVA